MRRALSALLAVAVTGLCLWFLLSPEIIRSLGRVATEAAPLPLLVAFVLGIVIQWLRAWRFAMLMAQGLALPEAGLVRIAFQLNFFNFVLPMRLGELSFPVLMRQRYGVSLLHATGVLLLARVFDLLNVICILLGAAAALNMLPGAGNWLLAAGSVVAGIAPFVVLLVGRAVRPHAVRLPYVGPIAETLSVGLHAVHGWRMQVVMVAVGFSVWLILGLMSILVADAVTSTISPAAAMFGGAAGNLAFALPVNGIAGLGPSQAAWVWATTQVGVPWDDAVVSALALHAVVLVNALLLGAVAMLDWPGDKAPAA